MTSFSALTRLGVAIAAGVTLAAAPAAAQVVRPLPLAPVPLNPAATTIATARAELFSAPAGLASTQAQFAYRDAVARYARGDVAGAREAAAEAMSILAEPAPPAIAAPASATIVPSNVTPGLGAQIFPPSPYGTEPVGGALQVDEDELVARARSAVGSCAAKKPDRLADAKRRFDDVWAAHARGDVVRERVAVRGLVERCGVLF